MSTSFFSKTAALTAFSCALGLVSVQGNTLAIASYSFSKEPASTYPDPDYTKLTNGEIVPNTFAVTGTPLPVGAAVGWLQNPADPEKPNPAIIFDLGSLKYVDTAAINYVLWPGAGVRAPSEVRISFSSDKENFSLEETWTGFDGSAHPSGYDLFTRNLALDLNGKAARFVRLDFRQGTDSEWGPNRSAWHWFDEISFSGREIDDLDSAGSISILKAVEFEFETDVGAVYQIHSSLDLQTWEPIGPKVLGNGETYRLFSSAGIADGSFFRVHTHD